MVAIEILAIGIPILCGFIMWSFLTLIKYIRIWRYKEEDDKGKKAEDSRRGNGLSGTIPIKRRSLFQITPTKRTEIDKKPARKVRRNPFRRRR